MKTEKIEDILTRYVNGVYTQKELDTLIKSARKREDDEAFGLNMDKLWEEAEAVQDTMVQSNEYEADAKYLLKQLSPAPKRLMLKTFLKYAAVVAVLVMGIWGVYYTVGILSLNKVSYITFNVNKGERQKITLPDGTKVILNSNTCLKYSVPFKGDVRKVEMDGEGFFDVAKDPDKPFIIHTISADVRVLGTSFNVKAYNEDDEVAVSVKTGKVQVDIENAALKLLPNEQLVLDKTSKEYRKHNEDITKIMLWTEGKLYFNRMSVQSLALELQRIYDCKISFAPGFTYDEYLYGEHENKSLESVLNSIKYSTGISYKKEGNKYILYKE